MRERSLANTSATEWKGPHVENRRKKDVESQEINCFESRRKARKKKSNDKVNSRNGSTSRKKGGKRG